MANKKVRQTINTTIIGTERNTFEIIKEYAEEKAVVDRNRRHSHSLSWLALCR